MRAALVLALLTACAPPLLDGQYSCADDRCPPGFFCHPDDVCRRAPPGELDASTDTAIDAATPDVPGRDVPPGSASYYEPCTRDEDCASDRCHFGFLPTPWAIGYCSEPCDLDTDCGAITGQPYANCSLAGACELYCVAASQCPLPFRCVGSFREVGGSGRTIGQCYPSDQPIAPGDVPCTIDSNCTQDLDCIDVDGDLRCRRPCDAGYACAEGERCMSAGSVGTYCLPMP